MHFRQRLTKAAISMRKFRVSGQSAFCNCVEQGFNWRSCGVLAAFAVCFCLGLASSFFGVSAD